MDFSSTICSQYYTQYSTRNAVGFQNSERNLHRLRSNGSKPTAMLHFPFNTVVFEC